MRVEELQGEITQRERHITNLKEDANNLQTSISHLNKEIEFKRQEINRIKSDTLNQIRYEKKLLHESRHDKTNKMSVRPAKTQVSLGIRLF